MYQFYTRLFVLELQAFQTVLASFATTSFTVTFTVTVWIVNRTITSVCCSLSIIYDCRRSKYIFGTFAASQLILAPPESIEKKIMEEKSFNASKSLIHQRFESIKEQVNRFKVASTWPVLNEKVPSWGICCLLLIEEYTKTGNMEAGRGAVRIAKENRANCQNYAQVCAFLASFAHKHYDRKKSMQVIGTLFPRDEEVLADVEHSALAGTGYRVVHESKSVSGIELSSEKTNCHH